MAHTNLPLTQQAIQLVGPGERKRNSSKPVHAPGPRQVLAKVEAVGLCFSDLKLLKQFSQHARKGGIIDGIDPAVLGEIPSYVPGDAPTVPGHEAVCRIVAVGDDVRHHRLGERCLVQTDYRALRTPNSNASFGYNFEGGLQEYVLMDERVVLDPESGERFLIPAPESLSASAVALVEPWACVEDSYAYPERTGIKAGGRLLIVVEEGFRIRGLRNAVLAARPASILAVGGDPAALAELTPTGAAVERLSDRLASLPPECCDDIVCFGAGRGTIEPCGPRRSARIRRSFPDR